MDFYNALIQVAVIAIPAILAITLHEAAHGYVARHFGDPTAYQQGRLTLNPIKHIDPIGTIAFPLLTSVMGGIIFGWAKPVPVNSATCAPKRDMFLGRGRRAWLERRPGTSSALIARRVVETAASSLPTVRLRGRGRGNGWNV